MKFQTTQSSKRAIEEYRRGEFLISTDPSKLDLNAIHGFLSKSYWETQGISGETVEHSIRGSLCFGVYDGDQQVGFARVISDGATFAFFYGGLAVGKGTSDGKPVNAQEPCPEVCPLALVLAGGFPPWPQAGSTHAPRTRTPEVRMEIVKLPIRFIVLLLSAFIPLRTASLVLGSFIRP
jgi:hypothetical protein